MDTDSPPPGTAHAPGYLPADMDPDIASTIGPWRLFVETATRLQNSLDAQLRRDHGLTLADFHLMLLLAEAPLHRMRMKDLSRRMVFSPSRLSYQVGVLCNKDLLRREEVPEDRRGLYAALTERGLQTFQQASLEHFEHVSRLFIDVVRTEDAAELHRIMTTLSENLTRLESPR